MLNFIRSWVIGLGLGVVFFVLVTLLSSCGQFKGAKGEAGAQGNEGPVGQPGAPGVDANPITVVKLCPGTTVYPSVFVEIAFCVDHKLYATYSANGGFSTEIPPGTYNSNAVGSSCTFTVLPNCVIQ